MHEIIETVGLSRVFRDRRAVDGLELHIAAGETYGLLGPNGAGKTTTIQMLTTLLAPSEGRALVCGLDVVGQAAEVRRRLGYVSQEKGVRHRLTGRESVELEADLNHVPRSLRARRVEEVLDIVGMLPDADRFVAEYSGGMQKRLDLACGLLHLPELLILDEPTLGLDVQSRHRVWDHLRRLRDQGITVLLATNYLDEADRLCDRITIIDGGREVVTGTPAELKRGVAADTVHVETTAPHELRTAVEGAAWVRQITLTDRRHLRILVDDAAKALPEVMRAALDRGIDLESVGRSAPTLDDVFLHHTGRDLTTPAASPTDTGETVHALHEDTRTPPARPRPAAEGHPHTPAVTHSRDGGVRSTPSAGGVRSTPSAGGDPSAPTALLAHPGRQRPIAPVPPSSPGGSRLPTGSAGPRAREVAALLRRWYLELSRERLHLAFTLLQPVIWLVFLGSAMGRAVDSRVVGTGDYIAFMLPGVIAFTVVSTGVSGAVPLLWDKETGYLNKLMSMPIGRSSLLISRLVFQMALGVAQAACILLVAAALGVRPATSLPGSLVVLAVAALLAMAFSALFMALACRAPDHNAFFAITGFVSLPILFTSNAFVPLDAMPAWMAATARLNPLTYAIESMRVLVVEGWRPSLTGDLLTLAAFAAAALALGVHQFRRLTHR
ncbi:ABC transporter permease [Sphaerisporangium album]|uniref:ABC transporter permease n=1 Tax=Sphaerisporangium album TaxID=509200 RepID=UPI0015F10158|nr:ABC transporter permease [Sphaerisporangium album]